MPVEQKPVQPAGKEMAAMSLHTSDLVLVPGRQLKPLDTISGFQVRPGFFRFFGATVIPGGVNFTIQSHGATSCELLLFHRDAEEPFAGCGRAFRRTEISG